MGLAIYLTLLPWDKQLLPLPRRKKKKKSLTSYLLFTMAINAALNVSNALSTGVCMAHAFDHLASS
jgi:hypothetical protein